MRYRLSCFRISLTSFLIAFIFSGFLYVSATAQESDPDKPIGVVVWNTSTFHQDLFLLPNLDYYYSYSGYLDLGVDVEVVSYYMSGTFHKFELVCTDVIMVLHHPNSSRVGHAVTEYDQVSGRHVSSPRLAAEMIHHIELECPSSVIIGINASPHDWFNKAPGSFNGLGPEYTDRVLTEYEELYGRTYPHYVGISLSENGDLSGKQPGEYVIEDQLSDYKSVASKHGVELWTSYINCKECSRDRWDHILSIAYEGTEGLFVANNHSRHGCYRGLVCNGYLTSGGQAFLEFVNGRFKSWEILDMNVYPTDTSVTYQRIL